MLNFQRKVAQRFDHVCRIEGHSRDMLGGSSQVCTACTAGNPTYNYTSRIIAAHFITISTGMFVTLGAMPKPKAIVVMFECELNPDVDGMALMLF